MLTVDWTAEPSEAAALTSDRLVSFNYDWHPSNEGPTWGQNASIVTIDLQNKRLRALSAAMSPAFLRIGGSEGDDAVYDIDGACNKTAGTFVGLTGIPKSAFCLTMPRWEEILSYANDTGLSIAFGLNVMYGRNCTTRPPAGCSAWDP
eukprot:SAG22_NODE_9178_length_605_cov_0.816206_1_plen_147_part_01